jgi:hypothetical protein
VRACLLFRFRDLCGGLACLEVRVGASLHSRFILPLPVHWTASGGLLCPESLFGFIRGRWLLPSGLNDKWRATRAIEKKQRRAQLSTRPFARKRKKRRAWLTSEKARLLGLRPSLDLSFPVADTILSFFLFPLVSLDTDTSREPSSPIWNPEPWT